MIQRVSVELFIILVIGLILGLIGPFGTFETPTGARMAFWIGSSLTGYAIFRPFIVVSQWVSAALKVPLVVSGGLALVIGAIPLTFLIGLFFADFDAARVLRWDGLPGLYFQVWIVGFIINAIFAFTLGRRSAQASIEDVSVATPEATPTPEMAPANQQTRLPATLGEIHAFKGEDHYVRVIAQNGEQLLLMRLRDAIADIGETAGLQVHRSWWVATAGVAKVNRKGRSAEIILKNGAVVPVSRDMIPRLREMRWL